jgi:hypothetical protein
VKRCVLRALRKACPTKPKSIWLTTKTYELAATTATTSISSCSSSVQDDRPQYTGLPEEDEKPRLDEARLQIAMGDIGSQMPLVFLVVGTIAVASSILVACAQSRAPALFLLLTFLCVAVLFVLKSAEFVAAAALVYAGGIMVLFLFVVMLINYRHLPRTGASKVWVAGWCRARDLRAAVRSCAMARMPIRWTIPRRN